jgi:hypothetical protein
VSLLWSKPLLRKLDLLCSKAILLLDLVRRNIKVEGSLDS